MAGAKGHPSVVRAHRTFLRLAAPLVSAGALRLRLRGDRAHVPQGRTTCTTRSSSWPAVVFAFVIVWLLLVAGAVPPAEGGHGPAAAARGPRSVIVVGFFLFGAVIVSALFPFGERTLAAVDKIQKNTQVDLTLEGFQWEWTAYYKDEGLVISGKTLTKPLVFAVPVDTPIRVTLVSRDVMHEFFVPAAAVHAQRRPRPPERLHVHAGQDRHLPRTVRAVLRPVALAHDVRDEGARAGRLHGVGQGGEGGDPEGHLPGEDGFGVDHREGHLRGTPTACRSSAGRPRPSR